MPIRFHKFVKTSNRNVKTKLAMPELGTLDILYNTLYAREMAGKRTQKGLSKMKKNKRMKLV